MFISFILIRLGGSVIKDIMRYYEGGVSFMIRKIISLF
ncbi:hypothetical protein BACOVA_00955 [Bacteroides ovatus ATCC 8483]|uniref:Uncharacterized protein n=1 Tax=Bacteroides ovatus (strain ATCC 8483 / DSM 1896 / JCM 5824 / BCRC 10623 / CCUG 4943 / NCTC 11153) TaxID=411476 RepID=A0AAN3ABH3_BACO1|nr:hypothetical protein BACOVA_00955 [Bacteroides ovatus ATCC 8483]